MAEYQYCRNTVNYLHMINNTLYLRSQLTSSASVSLISPLIINRFSLNFVKIIFQQNPNIPEHFLKLLLDLL